MEVLDHISFQFRKTTTDAHGLKVEPQTMREYYLLALVIAYAHYGLGLYSLQTYWVGVES